MKYAGSAKLINPKDLAQIGSTSLILGCHLKALETIGEGILAIQKVYSNGRKEIITISTNVLKFFYLS